MDIDGDGWVDCFEMFSDVWGFCNYYEFLFGLKLDEEGNIWVILCFLKFYYFLVFYCGWCFKVIFDGEIFFVCSGIWSFGGVGFNEYGVMFYVES